MSNLTTTMNMERCPECGADVRTQDRFCWNCGRSLRIDSPSPQPEQMQSASSMRLIVKTPTGEVLQEYPLGTAAVIIGRVAPADIVLKDREVSRRHTSVRYEQGHYMVRDERSANGTFVNGERLEPAVPYVLQDGDQVKIGQHILVFHAQQNMAESL